MPEEFQLPPDDDIVLNKIYILRNQKVMLDRDLAELYGVETKRLNEQVRRNASRFPEDFMFQLSEEEVENLMTQFATSSWGGHRKTPYAFTEHGILMLSGVLTSEKAIHVNIQIMRIFIRVRQLLMDTAELKLDMEKIRKKLENQGKNMELVFHYLDELSAKKEIENPRTRIGYKN
jgi:hypothetical protein